MNRILIAAVLFFGTLTGFAQKPAKAAATPPSPETKLLGNVNGQVVPTASTAQVKELKDALSVLQLDQLAIQTAKNTFAQTDPVAKKALDILNQAINSSPEVQKANAQEESDRQALVAKIEAMRQAQHLDKTWDWDFNQGRFVKVSQAAGPAAQQPAPAAPAPAPAKK